MRWDQTSCQRKKGRTVNDGEGTVVGYFTTVSQSTPCSLIVPFHLHGPRPSMTLNPTSLLSSPPNDCRRINIPLDPSLTKKARLRLRPYQSSPMSLSTARPVRHRRRPRILGALQSCSHNPELRLGWGPSAEEAHLLEMFDYTTRLSKTNSMSGWPAK